MLCLPRTLNKDNIQQNFPPAPINLLNWNNSFLRSFIQSNSIPEASATLPIQTSLLSTPATLPLCSYLDIVVGNNSETLSVTAPVPVPLERRLPSALWCRLMIKVALYRNWHEHYLQDKGDDTCNNNSAVGGGIYLVSFMSSKAATFNMDCAQITDLDDWWWNSGWNFNFWGFLGALIPTAKTLNIRLLTIPSCIFLCHSLDRHLDSEWHFSSWGKLLDHTSDRCASFGVS